MVSFIVVSKNIQEGKDYIAGECTILSISSFDQLVIGRETEEKITASVGIDAIKKTQRKIYLKPSQGPAKAIICFEGEVLTTEAQNALLKVLEEPPNNTYIYILTTNLEAILATIRSRCSIIKLAQSISTTSNPTLPSFSTLSLSEKLAVAEKQGKNKNLAQHYLEELLNSLHNQLHEQKNSEDVIQNILLVQQTLQELQTTNVNPRLAMERVMLEL